MKKTARVLFFTAVTTLAAGLNTSYATSYILSGPMDTLQAGTNGGFGSTAANGGTGTGTISGTYDDVTKVLNYSIAWQDLTSTITNMHFHNAPVGSGGGVDLGIPSPWISPKIGGDPALSAAREANLLAGNWYVNIHTSNFGSGEIRGQVLVTPVPEPTTASIAGVAILSLWTLARRQR